jgi:hypothetical protein
MSKKDGHRRERKAKADRMEHKAFQGRVRARMAKTGERYQLAFRRQQEAEAARELDPPRWIPPTARDVANAIASAAGDNTAQRLQTAIEASLWNEISARVDPGTLFDVERALGTFPEPRRGVAQGMQEVAAALEAPMVEATNEAVAASLRLNELKEKVRMAPTRAKMSRLEIASMLGARDENRAVFAKAGKAVAIVVRQDGHHPSGEVFPNALTASEFRMFGRNDERGQLLENKDAAVPLYFSHNNDGEFTDEGLVRYVKKVDYPGKPERVFRRE